MAVEKVSKERSKVVLRHIPPGFTSESLLQLLTNTLTPFPKYDFYHFAPADFSLAPYLSCRAYFNFVVPDSALIFKDKFDGQKFIDTNKIQSVGIVEYAPFQRVPKRIKKDVRCGTLEKDPDYLEFLKEINIEPESPPSIETIIDEIEKRRAARAEEQSSTALLEYIKNRRAERSLSPSHSKPQYSRRDRGSKSEDSRDPMPSRYKTGRSARGRNNSEEDQSHEYKRKPHSETLDADKSSVREKDRATGRRANDEFRSRNNIKTERISKSYPTKSKPEKEIYVPGKKKLEEPAKFILSSNKDSGNREKSDTRSAKDTSSDVVSKSYRSDRPTHEERQSYRREGYDGDNKEKEYRREGYDGDRKEHRRGNENFESDKDRERDDRDNDYYSDSYRNDRGGYRGSSYRGGRGYSRGGWRDERSRGRSSRSRGRSSRGHS